MNKNNNKRIAFILATVCGAILIAIALLCFTSRNKANITRQNQEYLDSTAEQIADSIDNALSEGYNNIKILSELVSSTLTEPSFNIASIQNLIKDSVFDFMEFADVDGMDHNITGGVSDAHDRKYYVDAKAGNTGMELIYVSRATKETLLMFYSPIYYEGEFVGSLVGAYQATNRITKLLNSEYFGEKPQSYFATDTGRVIASNQNYNPNEEIYVTDLVKSDDKAYQSIKNNFGKKDKVLFSLKDNTTGGILLKLKTNDGYFFQIFPEEANTNMVLKANKIGYELILMVLIVYIAVLLVVILFYNMQQRQVEDAKDEAEKANNAKTDFLFNMSHDIRTPMNAILGFTDIALKYNDDPEKVKESLNKIKTSGGHLLNLINDILEMSRIESGKLTLNLNPVNICDLFDEINLMSNNLAISKNIEFVTEIGEITNPYVFTDQLHINEVLINLISNAIKYTYTGGKVWFKLNQISEATFSIAKYRFEVMDNGIGMSKEFQEHLFETFAREENATVAKIEGAGLGLSIVKKIVDLADGTIIVNSLENVGSTFVVEFPFQVMSEREVESYVKQDFVNDDEISNMSLIGKKILLVEDNVMNREIATEVLSELGVTIETAEDGLIAVRKVQTNGVDYYDLILMDIQMPVMNGYEATKEIRSLIGGDKVPIIALSANAFEEDKQKSISVGMNDHIAKPINVKQLFSSIKKVIN